MPEIAEIIKKQQNQVTIEVREVNPDDISKKKENPEYLSDELLSFTDTGIKVVLATEQLKSLIPKTIKN